jgi:hypothetical protein
MTKKFFLIVMAALVSASLFFLGCPTDSGDGDGDNDPVFSSKTNSVTENPTSDLGLVGNEVVSSNPAVATATVGTGSDAGKVVITSVGAGTATITVFQTGDTEKYFGAKIPVTVAADGTITIGTIVKGEPSTSQSYTLNDNWTNTVTANGSGLSIDYQRKGTASNKVYIKLSGAIGTAYQTAVTSALVTNGGKWSTAAWTNGSTSSAAGRYAGVYLRGLFPADGLANIAVKQTNDAFRFYTGAGGLLTEKPQAPTANAVNIWVPSTTSAQPIKWKFYDSLPQTETWGVIMWSNAQNKAPEMIFEKYDGTANTSQPIGTNSHFATVIVDYSAVVFSDALNDAGLTSVLDQTVAAGSEAGTSSSSAKTAAITVAAATEAGTVAVADIVPATGASAKLYSDANFQTEVATGNSIALTLGGTKDVYILVTAGNTTTKVYYKVSITKPEDVTSSVALNGTAESDYTSNLSISSATKIGTALTIVVGGTDITSGLGIDNTSDFQMADGSKGHESNVGLVKITGLYQGFNPAVAHIEWQQGPSLGGYEVFGGSWPPTDNTTYYKVLDDATAFTNLANNNATYQGDGVLNGVVYWKTDAGVYNKAAKIAINTSGYTTLAARRIVLQEQDDPTEQVHVLRFIADNGSYMAPAYTVTIDYSNVTWATNG